METKVSKWLAGFVRTGVLVTTVLLVTPILALALTPAALLMAPLAVFALPFVASALIPGTHSHAKRALTLRGTPRGLFAQPLPCR